MQIRSQAKLLKILRQWCFLNPLWEASAKFDRKEARPDLFCACLSSFHGYIIDFCYESHM